MGSEARPQIREQLRGGWLRLATGVAFLFVLLPGPAAAQGALFVEGLTELARTMLTTSGDAGSGASRLYSVFQIAEQRAANHPASTRRTTLPARSR